MKTIYTKRDIDDMHAAGVTELEIDDEVVLTELARERTTELGLPIKRVEKRSGQPMGRGMPRLAVAPQMPLPPVVVGPPATTSPTSPSPPSAPSPPPTDYVARDSEQVAHIKSAVIARLGTTEHNDLLDQIIPRILARLNQT